MINMTTKIYWFKFCFIALFILRSDGQLFTGFLNKPLSPLLVPSLFSTVLSQRTPINRQQGYQINSMRDNSSVNTFPQPDLYNVQREQLDRQVQNNVQNEQNIEPVQPLRNVEARRHQTVNNLNVRDPYGVIGIDHTNRPINVERTTVEVQKHNVEYQGYSNIQYNNNPIKSQQLYPQQPYRTEPGINYAIQNQSPPNQFESVRYPQQTIIPNGVDPIRDNDPKNRIPIPSAVAYPEINQSAPGISSLAITNFGLNLLNLLNSPQENVAISPLSISLVLALIQQGTTGEAQMQINNALGLNPRESVVAFNNINNVLKGRISSNQLKLASNLFVDSAFELEPQFKSTAIRNFGSQATLLSFRYPNNAAQKINNWVSQKTENRIKELISPDKLSPDTKLVIANAIFFKGLWKTMFHPEATATRPFTTGRLNVIMTPFMRVRRSFRNGLDEVNHLKFVVLPFEGEQYSLILLLPIGTNTLEGIVKQLKGERLSAYTRAKEREVELEVPKFTIKEDLDLNIVLHKMGVSRIFMPRLSNLEGIGNYQGVAPEISSAVHSAMLSIDERGGTAAAATAFAAVALSYDEYEQLVIDKPFLVVLWDHELSLPLFLVKINNPSNLTTY